MFGISWGTSHTRLFVLCIKFRFTCRVLLVSPVLKHCKVRKYYNKDCNSSILEKIYIIKVLSYIYLKSWYWSLIFIFPQNLGIKIYTWPTIKWRAAGRLRWYFCCKENLWYQYPKSWPVIFFHISALFKINKGSYHVR